MGLPQLKHFDKDPNNRDTMSYKDHMEKQVAEGKVDKDWEKRVEIGRVRSGTKVLNICIGKNSK